jgi:uncharacterized coiled-coil DUF342 family protein
MEPTNLTVEILKEIREEVRATKDELRSTRDELRSTKDELREEIRSTRIEVSDRIERLETRQTQSELRLATELVAVASAVGLVTAELRGLRADRRHDRELLLGTTGALRAQVDEHEKRLGALEKKTG